MTARMSRVDAAASTRDHTRDKENPDRTPAERVIAWLRSEGEAAKRLAERSDDLEQWAHWDGQAAAFERALRYATKRLDKKPEGDRA